MEPAFNEHQKEMFYNFYSLLPWFTSSSSFLSVIYILLEKKCVTAGVDTFIIYLQLDIQMLLLEINLSEFELFQKYWL